MKRAQGFSLVELMVAVTLGLLVAGAAIAAFIGSRSAFQATSGIALLSENGRFALDVLEQSIRSAGYIACNRAGATNNNLLNTSVSQIGFDFSAGLGGYEASGTAPGNKLTLLTHATVDSSASDWSPALDTSLNGVVGNSDVLVIRSSVPRAAAVYATTAVPSGTNTITVSSAGPLLAGQLAAISDCTKSVTFQISKVQSGTSATVKLASSADVPGNTSNALPLEFPQGAVVTPVTTMIYYIGVGADGDSALRCLEFLNGVVNGSNLFFDEELVPDIESLQVLYGIDTTGTQTPSSYVTADKVTDFGTVVSLKVAVLAASPPNLTPAPLKPLPSFTLLGTQVSAPQDRRSRKVFDATVTVRSAVN